MRLSILPLALVAVLICALPAYPTTIATVNVPGTAAIWFAGQTDSTISPPLYIWDMTQCH
jgi:hypothetical protein